MSTALCHPPPDAIDTMMGKTAEQNQMYEAREIQSFTQRAREQARQSNDSDGISRAILK